MGLLVVRRHDAALGRDLRVLDEVDRVLRMLDPDAHREVLARHRDAAREEHVHRVARRVAEREDRDVRRDLLAGLELQARQRAVAPREEVRDLRAVAQRRSVLEKMLPHVSQDDDEAVGADVGLGVHEDRIRRAEAMERLEDDLDLVVSLPARELAVRERPRAALAELHVRLGVEDPRRPELHDLPVAVFRRVAALEDRDRDASVHESERREEARRARADDGDFGLRVEFRQEQGRRRKGLGRPEAKRCLGNEGERLLRSELDGDLPVEDGLLPRVERAAHEREVGETIAGDAEQPRDRREIHDLRGACAHAREPVAGHGEYCAAASL